MPGIIGQAVQVLHEDDPAVTIRTAVQPYLDKYLVGGTDVLIGVYKREDNGKEARTTGGILIPQRAADEDDWQGNVGLILKMGPLAFQTEKLDGWWANGEQPHIGSWVVFDIKDGYQHKLGKKTVRLIQDQYIRAHLLDLPFMVA